MKYYVIHDHHTGDPLSNNSTVLVIVDTYHCAHDHLTNSTTTLIIMDTYHYASDHLSDLTIVLVCNTMIGNLALVTYPNYHCLGRELSTDLLPS